jgi:hypothetical protein
MDEKEVTHLHADASEEAAPDPFDPASLAISGDMAAELGVKKLLVSVPVRKPSRQEFFRVDPRPNYQMNTAVLELRDERETYLIAPQMRAAIPGEIKPVTLRLCANRTGVVFLWPIPLPAEDGRSNRWHEVARRAAELAERRWVRLVLNMAAGAYEIFEAQAEIGEPEFPDKSFRDLLELGFGEGRLIDRPDHGVIQRLMGQV